MQIRQLSLCPAGLFKPHWGFRCLNNSLILTIQSSVIYTKTNCFIFLYSIPAALMTILRKGEKEGKIAEQGPMDIANEWPH